MKLFQKALSLVMTLVLLIALTVPAAAAAKATAATMKLQSKSGTVTITKSTGKAVTYKAGMSLYNGYTITTGSKSYANISVDGSKVLKVDASSSVSISKSGKKLKLYVNSGSAFFNVTKKLAGDESMSVQTSTMTAGIRGTSGVVSADSASAASGFALYDGSASVVCLGASGTVAVPVSAGESLSASLSAAPAVSPVVAAEIPGFAAVAIAADPVLQQRIAGAGVLDVAEVIKDSQNRLEQEEREHDELAKKIEQNILNSVVRPEPPKPVAPVGGGGGGSYTPPDNYQIIGLDENKKETVVKSGYWSDFPALAEGQSIKIIGNVTADLKGASPNANITVASGASFTLQNTGGGSDAHLSGTITNSGACVINAAVKCAVTVPNDGTISTATAAVITNNNGATLTVSANVENTAEDPGKAGLSLKNSGTATLNDGELKTTGYVTVENKGTLLVAGSTVTVTAVDSTKPNGMYTAINNAAAAELDISGGTVRSYAKPTSVPEQETSKAYAVYSEGSFTMTGGMLQRVGNGAFYNKADNTAAPYNGASATLEYIKKETLNNIATFSAFSDTTKNGVTTYGLDKALAAVDSSVSSEFKLTLQSDCTMNAAASIPAAVKFTLDGGGNTVNYVGNATNVFTVDGASPSFVDVTIQTEVSCALLNIKSGSAEIKGVTLSGCGADAPVVKLEGGTLTMDIYSIDGTDYKKETEIINTNPAGVAIANSEGSNIVGNAKIKVKRAEGASTELPADADSLYSIVKRLLSGISENDAGTWVKQLSGTEDGYWTVSLTQ